MRLLLDTHILLWAAMEPERLPSHLRALLEDADNILLVSAASAFEIATKHRLGKLPGATQLLAQYSYVLRELVATELPITTAHALKAGSWNTPHRDPFDRMLAAQASMEQVPLVSTDAVMPAFGIDVLA
ncbi:type II toxin-antitoxin system VapC family toxin [Thiomonas sp.]|jgi:PIN domain nuclease of toxin-antitoxin system|uniref:type II toxin-antitoxin system VapC family toxin n=1 Tax=Thiomonas sp. TaxID=2047785 RepID=UPI0026381B73|nr:type II toxin-antitoxin system VapC family toxin [Thiomonas sp.]